MVKRKIIFNMKGENEMERKENFEKGIENLRRAILQNYVEWCSKTTIEVDENRIQDFENSLWISHGRKYTAVWRGDTIWGFVVNSAIDPKFQLGDILKPSGWRTPARNFERGNIFESDMNVHWAGAC